MTKRSGWIQKAFRSAGQGVSQASFVLTNFLMGLVFIFVILVSADAVFRSYLDIHYTSVEIKQTLTEIKTYLMNLPTSNNHQLAPEAESFLETLKNQSTNSLDSNTISFLFQIFTFCLFSAGVYLLTLIRSSVKKAQEKISQITTFTADYPTSTIILSYLLQAYQTSWLLRTEKDNSVQVSHITHARDVITKLLLGAIQKAKDDKIGIEPSHYDTFLDLLQYIIDNLQGYVSSNNNRNKSEIDLLIQACDNCKILLAPELKENYQKQLAILLGKK